MLWDVVADEAAKTVTAEVSGVLLTGAGKLLRSLRHRVPELPDDRELAELVAQRGRTDPAFARELADALADAGIPEGTGSAVPPPALFLDRDAIRTRLATPGVWVVAGSRGAGKTALVTRVGHDAAGRFPGGQAYVDLDLYRDGEVLRTAEVKLAVLRQFGVTPIAPAEPVLGEQYLRALLHRRFVLVLDNVVGAAEARVLAQPWPSGLVLVTTRKLTDDLRMWSPAPPVVLHGLDEPGAWGLLADRCGPDLLAAEPAAAARLLELCDRMPFAILQAGALLARRRGEPGAVAAVLRDLDGAPDAGGLVRSCLTRAVAELAPATAADLAVLATHPGEDIGLDAALAMLGRSDRASIDELVDACLAEVRPPGRLSVHRLVRRFVTGPTAAQPAETDAAFDRLLAFLRDHAVAADLAGGDRLRRYPVPDVPAWSLPHHAPLDWLEAEAGMIAGVLPQAYHRGRHTAVVQLCGALEVLLTNRGHHWLIAGAMDWGILAARALGRPVVEARCHAMRGRILTQVHLLDQAAQALDTAWRLVSDVDDARMHSSVLEFHARLAEDRAEAASSASPVPSGPPRSAVPLPASAAGPPVPSAGPDYADAIETFRRCIALDGRAGLSRSLGLHQRMLANVLVKAGRAEEGLALLAQAREHTSDPRNEARVRMVRARAHAALGAVAQAQAEVVRAAELIAQVGATQYALELADIEAEIALRAGDVEAARSRWGWIAQAYWRAGHPRFDAYLARLSRLPAPPG